MGHPVVKKILSPAAHGDVVQAVKGQKVLIDGMSLPHMFIGVGNNAFKAVHDGNLKGIVSSIRQRVHSICDLSRNVVKIVFDGDGLKLKEDELRENRRAPTHAAQKSLQKLVDSSDPNQHILINKACVELCQSVPFDLFLAIWDDLQELKTLIAGTCELVLEIAPREADHQIIKNVREDGFTVVIAQDTDYILHADVCCVYDFQCKQNSSKSKNAYYGHVYEPAKILEFAKKLKNKTPKQKEELIIGNPSKGAKAPVLKPAEVSLSVGLFDLINKRGIAAVSDVALMSQNDYRNVDQCGTAGAVEVLHKVAKTKEIYSPEVAKLAAALPRVADTYTQIMTKFYMAFACFHCGTVVRAGVEQPLSNRVHLSADEQRDWIGVLRTDTGEIQKRMYFPHQSQYDRYQNNVKLFHPAVPLFDHGRFNLTAGLVRNMPTNLVKLHLAARCVAVPSCSEEARDLLGKVQKTETQPDYGPPRIIYPELLKDGVVYKPPPDLGEDADDVESRQLPNKIKDWPEMGRGDGWVTDWKQVGLLSPQVELKGYRKWFQKEWRSDQLDGLHLTRSLIKASQNTVNRNDIHLHYLCPDKTIDDTAAQKPKDWDDANGTWVPPKIDNPEYEEGVCYFRSKFLHSFTSTNVNSVHSGYLYPVVKCKYETSEDGMPFVVEILDAACTCQAKECKWCWHIAALLYVAEEQERPRGSLVPESPTSRENAWHSKNRKKHKKFRRDSPLCEIPTKNNKRKFHNRSPTKTKRGTVRKPKSDAKLKGGGCRFAQTYKSVTLDDTDIDLRNDPEVIAARGDLYDAIADATGVRCAAEIHWPAKQMPSNYYTVIPITSADYLRGQFSEQESEDLG